MACIRIVLEDEFHTVGNSPLRSYSPMLNYPTNWVQLVSQFCFLDKWRVHHFTRVPPENWFGRELEVQSAENYSSTCDNSQSENSCLQHFYEINIIWVIIFSHRTDYENHNNDEDWRSKLKIIASIIASARIILLPTVPYTNDKFFLYQGPLLYMMFFGQWLATNSDSTGIDVIWPSTLRGQKKVNVTKMLGVTKFLKILRN